MRKKLLSLLLALVMCLSQLPATAFAANDALPDWYFLFAIFKNVDADCVDKDGVKQHTTYTMSQEELDMARKMANEFEEYMNQMGVMRAHIDIVEIDTTVRELKEWTEWKDGNGSYISAEQAAPFLKEKVDLDRYDHVTCVTSLGIRTGYGGVTGSEFENGAGHSCINFINRERCLNAWAHVPFLGGYPVHEFLHFMERMNQKWGVKFDLHKINETYKAANNASNVDILRICYADVIRNQVKAHAEAGSGVLPAAWQYSPRALRSTRELTVPSGAAGIGDRAFTNWAALTKVSIPASTASIGTSAFQGCTGLTEVTASSGLTSIGTWAFGNCAALTRVFLPASVAHIEYAAFWGTGLTDVYYNGTPAQWQAIQIDEYNGSLLRANIHYNSLMADVKTTDWFAQSVVWALEKGITAGTGGGRFSPGSTCTQAQILTFLWRANGSPAPAGTVRGSEYYAPAVQWARERGIIVGTLDPDNPCTRSDVVTYLWRLAGSPRARAFSFTDVPAGASYAGAVNWAVEQGVTAGVSKERFGPDSICTRGQIVTFLYSALAK